MVVLLHDINKLICLDLDRAAWHTDGCQLCRFAKTVTSEYGIVDSNSAFVVCFSGET